MVIKTNFSTWEVSMDTSRVTKHSLSRGNSTMLLAKQENAAMQKWQRFEKSEGPDITEASSL